MAHPRVALLAVTLLVGPITAAGAQMIVGPSQGPAPGPTQGPGPTLGPGPAQGPVMGTGPMMGPGPMSGPPQGQNMPPCLSAFMPMREEAEKRAGFLKVGIERKKPRPELCNLFRRFSEAEEKVVKYAVTNQANCGIPPQAVAEMKKNHGKTVEVRDKVCAADAPAKPAGPNLGEALGTRTLPTSETTKSGTGTLDTLSGNPLAR
jgi:hypothetical protein